MQYQNRALNVWRVYKGRATLPSAWDNRNTFSLVYYCTLTPPSVSTSKKHPPARSDDHKDWVLQVFGDESCHDDGEGDLLDLNPEINQEQAEQLQRPRQDVNALLIHQRTVTVTHGETDESHHCDVTWRKQKYWLFRPVAIWITGLSYTTCRSKHAQLSITH